MRKPKWMNREPETTRSRSKRSESSVAKLLKGKLTINSGATLGQNDIVTDFAEIEDKTTAKESYRISLADWDKLVKKADTGKIPMLTVNFEHRDLRLAVLPLDDLVYLLHQIEKRVP